jgi:hypothetical protein
VSYPQVGDQDPEQKNSPIAMESDDESQLLRQEIPGEGVCFFNGEAFEQGTLVQSGATILRSDRGIWVPVGNVESDIP